MKKRGLSSVISVILLLLLTMIVVSIVWVVITNIVKSKIETSEACFGIYDKVTLDSENTCYDSTNEKIRFSVSLEDLEVEEILVSIVTNGISKTITLSGSENEELEPYPAGETTTAPTQGQGKTYLWPPTTERTEKPNLIRVAPKIKGNICEITDSIENIPDC